MKFSYFLLLGLVIVFFSCNKDSEQTYPNTPSLVLMQQNTDVITIADEESFLLLKFNFTDGDGDIGRLPTDEDTSFYVTATYLNDTAAPINYYFPFPQIGANSFQKNGGIAGAVDLYFENAYFFPRRDSAHLSGHDTLNLSIILEDIGGNRSEVINVGPIYIQP